MEKKKEYIVGIKEVHIHRVIVEAENEQEAKELASIASGDGLEFDHSYGMDSWCVTEILAWICEVAIGTTDHQWQTVWLSIPGSVKEDSVATIAENEVYEWCKPGLEKVSFVKAIHIRRAEENEKLPILS
jgi:hypothetical protein